MVAIGVYVASHEEIVQLAVNDPNSDPLQDWYYWTNQIANLQAVTTQQTRQWDIDIRSQRRLRGGYDLVMVMAGNPANTVAVDLNMGIRALWAIT